MCQRRSPLAFIFLSPDTRDVCRHAIYFQYKSIRVCVFSLLPSVLLLLRLCESLVEETVRFVIYLALPYYAALASNP